MCFVLCMAHRAGSEKADSHFHFIYPICQCRTCFLGSGSSKDKEKLLLVSKIIIFYAHLNIFRSMHLQYMFGIKSTQVWQVSCLTTGSRFGMKWVFWKCYVCQLALCWLHMSWSIRCSNISTWVAIIVFVTPASDKEQAVYHLFNLFPLRGISL